MRRPALSTRLAVVPGPSGLAVLAYYCETNGRYYPVQALAEPIHPHLAPFPRLSYTPLPQ
jgi:hypothetical protein